VDTPRGAEDGSLEADIPLVALNFSAGGFLQRLVDVVRLRAGCSVLEDSAQTPDRSCEKRPKVHGIPSAGRATRSAPGRAVMLVETVQPRLSLTFRRRALCSNTITGNCVGYTRPPPTTKSPSSSVRRCPLAHTNR